MKDVFFIYKSRCKKNEIQVYKLNDTVYYFTKCQKCNKEDNNYLDLIDNKESTINHFFLDVEKIKFNCKFCQMSLQIMSRCYVSPNNNDKSEIQYWILGDNHNVSLVYKYEYDSRINNVTNLVLKNNLNTKIKEHLQNHLIPIYNDGLKIIQNDEIRTNITFDIEEKKNDDLLVYFNSKHSVKDFNSSMDLISFIHEFLFSEWSLNSLSLLGINKIVYLYIHENKFNDNYISEVYNAKYIGDE